MPKKKTKSKNSTKNTDKLTKDYIHGAKSVLKILNFMKNRVQYSIDDVKKPEALDDEEDREEFAEFYNIFQGFY